MANASDLFDRPDSLVSLGTADSGQPWVEFVGTWGLNGGRAYVVASGAGGQNTVVVDTSLADGTLTVTLQTLGGDCGVIFRATDGQNYYVATYSASAMWLYKVVADGYNSLGALSIDGASGDILSVVLDESSIDIQQNGVSKIATTDSTWLTQTKQGLRAFGVDGTYFDIFSFIGAAPPPSIDVKVLSRAILRPYPFRPGFAR